MFFIEHVCRGHAKCQPAGSTNWINGVHISPSRNSLRIADEGWQPTSVPLLRDFRSKPGSYTIQIRVIESKVFRKRRCSCDHYLTQVLTYSAGGTFNGIQVISWSLSCSITFYINTELLFRRSSVAEKKNTILLKLLMIPWLIPQHPGRCITTFL